MIALRIGLLGSTNSAPFLKAWPTELQNEPPTARRLFFPRPGQGDLTHTIPPGRLRGLTFPLKFPKNDPPRLVFIARSIARFTAKLYACPPTRRFRLPYPRAFAIPTSPSRFFFSMKVMLFKAFEITFRSFSHQWTCFNAVANDPSPFSALGPCECFTLMYVPPFRRLYFRPSLFAGPLRPIVFAVYYT